MFLLVATYALMAATFSIAWSIMQYAQPFFTIGLRMTLAGTFLLGYLYLFNRTKFQIFSSDRLLFVQAIFFHIFLAYVSEFYALKTISGAKTALIYNLSPFVAAVFTYFIFSQKLTLRQWVGLLIGFLGFIPILYSQSASEMLLNENFFISLDEIALLISVISSTYGWIVVKKLMHLDYHPLMVNGVAMFFAGIFSLLGSLIFESWAPIPVDMANIKPFLVGIFALIIIANIICYNLFAWLLRFYSPVWLTFVGFITPLFAALYDYLFFSKTVTPAFFATALIVFCGLYVFYWN